LVVIDINFGGERFLRGFEGFDAQMKDLTEPLDAIAEDFYEVEKVNFAKGGTPIPFKPLSAEYSRWKRRHYPGKTIMRLRDNLYEALTGGMPSDLSKARPVRVVKKNSLDIGFESSYGMYHQTHGRKVVQITEETRRRWGRIIHEWAYDQLRYRMMGR
jgi:hypothetical protein